MKLFTTPCAWAYSPPRIDARLGEQSDVVQKWLLEQRPSAASRSMFGVFRCGIAHAAQRVPALVVGEDEHHVGLFGGQWLADREQGNSERQHPELQ